MNKKVDLSQAPGHWVLARVGKKVLRPGGKELSIQMLEALEINEQDHVIEFAPGMGFTAQLVNERNPKSYRGIELNKEAAKRLTKLFKNGTAEIIQANANAVPLANASANKLYGEAMLTMQSPEQKLAIVQEAGRLLQKGGLYGIHEIGLIHEDITMETRKNVHKSMAMGVKIPVQPLTTSEWTALLEQAGFKVRDVYYRPITFLQLKQIIKDEGLWQTFKIGFNVLIRPKARRRIQEMRASFLANKDNLQAIVIIAEKL